MNSPSVNQILSGLGLLLALVFANGCRQESAPPAPLTVEQLPAEFDKVYASAKPQPKALAKQIVAEVKNQEYDKAFMNLQSLASQSGLTKEQARLAARGLLTVNGLLQSAQAQGDEKAKAVLNFQRLTK